jgi:tetraacyldisaccharide 4'-kinase
LARADAVVVLLPSDLPGIDKELAARFAGKTVLVAHLEPVTALPAEPQVGFAGIAKPWRVERALKAAGCRLADFAPLADHREISESTLKFFARRAADLGAGLITTEKDWVRLSPSWRERVTSWPVRASFDDDQALDRLLATVYPEPAPG